MPRDSPRPGPVVGVADQASLQAEVRLELAVPLPRGLALFGAVVLDAALVGRADVVVSFADEEAGLFGMAPAPALPWGVVLGQLGLRWSPW